MESQRVGHDLVTEQFSQPHCNVGTSIFYKWQSEYKPVSFCQINPCRSHDRLSPNPCHEVRCMMSSISCVQLFATLCTIAQQAPLSMGFSRQEYWGGLPSPSPKNLPIPGSNLCLMSSALADRFLTTSTTWEVHCCEVEEYIWNMGKLSFWGALRASIIHLPTMSFSSLQRVTQNYILSVLYINWSQLDECKVKGPAINLGWLIRQTPIH